MSGTTAGPTGAVVNNQPNLVHVTMTPTAQRHGEEERKQGEPASLSSIEGHLLSLTASIAALTQQNAELRQHVSELDRRVSTRPPSSPSAGEHQYSASASLPLPPVVQISRKTDPRRQSMGVPTSAFTPAPVTPARSKTVRMQQLDDAEEGDGAEHSVAGDDSVTDPPGLPTMSKHMREIKKSILNTIKQPFQGNANKDAESVINFTERLDTAFSIEMGEVEEGRLDIARSLLAGTALKWMNRKVQELKDRAAAGEATGPIEWVTLRQPFIDAHLGINTAATFKAQLRALRLGPNTSCPTPVELNKAFDHLAELAFPDRRADSMATVLGDEYKFIIAKSDSMMYKYIELNQNPTTIDEWKTYVARRWAAEQNVEATLAMIPTRPAWKQVGIGGGRAGAVVHGRGSDTTVTVSAQSKPSVNAVSVSGELTDMQGEAYTSEGEPDAQQLSAAEGNRGGKSGRGGRGRGRGAANGASSMNPERQRLYNEQRCFRCKEVGHTQAACPKPPTPRTQPSNK